MLFTVARVLFCLGAFAIVCRNGMALPSGAPSLACDNMIPQHNATPQGSGDGGYKMSHNMSAGYFPGEVYQVNLTSTKNPFRGFFCQVRKVGGTDVKSAVGEFLENSFLPADKGTRLSSCTPKEIGVTHTSKSDKTYRSFLWRSPKPGVGPIQLWCSFVEVKLIFWVDLKSAEIKEIGSGFQEPVAMVMVPKRDLPFDLSTCGTSKGCYRSPNGCTETTCDQLLTQTVSGNTVTFELMAKAQSWVALGINPQDQMNGAEVMACQRTPDGTQINLKHSYNADWDNTLVNASDPASKLFDSVSLYSNGYLRCKFSRSLSSAQAKTFEFGKQHSYFYLFAYNDKPDGGAVAGIGLVHKHSYALKLPQSISVFDTMNYNADISFDLSTCGTSKGCYRSPNGCTETTCDQLLTQTVSDNTVTFELMAKAQSWVALGINPQNQMNGAEVMACQLTPDGTQINFKHSYNAGFDNSLMNASDPMNKLFNTASSYSNGYLRCRFSRSLSTSEPKAFEFGKLHSYYYLFALNDKPDGKALATQALVHKHNYAFKLPENHTVFDTMNDNANLDVSLDGCGATKGCYRVPLGCQSTVDCRVIVTQQPDLNAKTVTFELSAKVTGWIALGFNTEDQMVGAEVFGCQPMIDGGGVAVKHAYNPALSNELIVINTPNAFLTGVSASNTNGRITCRFNRSFASTNSKVVELGSHKMYYYLVALRDYPQPVAANKGLVYIHSEDPVILPAQQSVVDKMNINSDLVFDLSTCGTSKGCYRSPKGCTETTCNQLLTQTVSDNTVTFELMAKAQSWVALGINPQNQMNGAEVMACQRTPDGTMINFKHGYNAKSDNILINASDPVSKLFYTESSYSNGYLRCRFSRSLASSESHMYELGESHSYFYLFALNDQPSSSGGAAATDPLNHKHTLAFSLPEEYSVNDTMNDNAGININVTTCGKTKGCALAPAGCRGDACNIIFTQQVNPANPEVAIFELYAQTAGWVAVGFADKQQMGGADVFACQLNTGGKSVTVKNLHNSGHDNVLDDQNNASPFLSNMSADFVNGRIYCRFARPIKTPGKYDKDLSVKHYLLFAVNSNAQGDPDSALGTIHNQMPYISPTNIYSTNDNFLLNINGTVPPPPQNVSIDLSSCGTAKGCYRTPDGCDVATCTQVLTQQVDEKSGMVTFELLAKAEGWIALGVNTERKMDAAEVFACQRTSAGNFVTVKHLLNDGHANGFLPGLKPNAEILNPVSHYENGQITCRFSRMITSSAAKTYTFGKDKKYYYIMAMNTQPSGTAGPDDALVEKHNVAPIYVGGEYSVFDKLNVGAALTFDLTGCGSTKGCAIAPYGCYGDSCDFIYTQRRHDSQKDTLVFELSAHVAGWVAVGFNDDMKMGGADVLACQLEPGGRTVAAKNLHNVGVENLMDKPGNAAPYLTEIQTAYIDGHVRCRFSRLVKTEDTEFDADLSIPHHLLFAVNSNKTAPANTALEAKHNQMPNMTTEQFSGYDNFLYKLNSTNVPMVKIDLSTCNTGKGCFTMPLDCKVQTHCKYIFTQRLVGQDMVEIELSAQATGWVAIGFNDKTKMDGGDVLACQSYAGGAYPKNLHNVNHNNQLDDVKEPAAYMLNVTTSVVDGIISCRFLRPIKTDSPFDKDLFVPHYYQYATSGGEAQPDDNLRVEHSRIPLISPTRYTAGSLSINHIAQQQLLKAHAITMVLTWLGFSGIGLLLPLAFKNFVFKDNATWFKFHRALMVLVWLLTMLGIAFTFISRKKWLGSGNVHAVLGVVVTVLTFIQPLGAMMRPAKTAPNRYLFNWAHGIVGVSAQVLAGACVILGYSQYNKFFDIKYSVLEVIAIGYGLGFGFWLLSLISSYFMQGSVGGSEAEKALLPSVQDTVRFEGTERSACHQALFLMYFLVAVGIAVAVAIMLGEANVTL